MVIQNICAGYRNDLKINAPMRAVMLFPTLPKWLPGGHVEGIMAVFELFRGLMLKHPYAKYEIDLGRIVDLGGC